MSATRAAQIPVQLDLHLPGGFTAGDTQALLTAMLRASDRISDFMFSPGRMPQVEIHDQLIPVQAPGLKPFSADDTRRIASDLIGGNKQAISLLREQGYCDVSYALPGLARFRANVFIQRGSCAIVMRVIPTRIPDFATLGLPVQLSEIAGLRDGIVLVTGSRGSGKSAILAALLDQINERRTCHIITIEDSIEFLHAHKRATIHQRELHSDTPSIAQALRASLRQAPRIIMLGEMRDRETMELVMEAAETGHLILSSLTSLDITKAIDRIMSAFPVAEYSALRTRLSKLLRCMVSRRLIPRQNGIGRIAVVEILIATAKIQNCVKYDESPSQNLLEVIKAGAADGMQYFDAEIAKLVRAGTISVEAALANATDPGTLQRLLNGSGA